MPLGLTLEDVGIFWNFTIIIIITML